jgi:hypothetical protein
MTLDEREHQLGVDLGEEGGDVRRPRAERTARQAAASIGAVMACL